MDLYVKNFIAETMTTDDRELHNKFKRYLNENYPVYRDMMTE